MDEPATKKRKTLHAPLNENLESLANLLEILQHQVADILNKKDEPSVAFSDIQSFQASLSKFRKSFDRPAGRYRCPDCAKAFVRLDRLLVHCDTYHKERHYLKLVCPCPQSFKHLRDRNTHLRKCHQDYYNEEQILILGGPDIVTGAGETQSDERVTDNGANSISPSKETDILSIRNDINEASTAKDTVVISAGGNASNLSIDKGADPISVDKGAGASSTTKDTDIISIDIDSRKSSVSANVSSIGKGTGDPPIGKHARDPPINNGEDQPDVAGMLVSLGRGNETPKTELPHVQPTYPRVMKLIIKKKKRVHERLGENQ